MRRTLKKRGGLPDGWSPEGRVARVSPSRRAAILKANNAVAAPLLLVVGLGLMAAWLASAGIPGGDGMAAEALSGAPAATITVNSTEDTDDVQPGDGHCGDELGRCTLRGAIQESNAREGDDEIRFRIAIGVQVIRPESALPVVFDTAVIDATTQPGYGGWPAIHIDGSAAGDLSDGLVLVEGKHVVKGLAITDFAGHGVVLADGGENRLLGLFVGLAPDGADAGNGGHGIQLVRSAANVIGGAAANERNVISGNGGHGVYVSDEASKNNLFLGNFIGTDAEGMSAVANRADGIAIFDSAGNTIGGHRAGEPNLISGNGDDGVEIRGSGSFSNTVSGSLIGTDREGRASLANAGSGVAIHGAVGNVVSGTLLSGNAGYGLEILGGDARENRVLASLVGTGVDGTRSVGNRAGGVAVLGGRDNVIGEASRGNRVAGNRGAGITVSGDGAVGNQLRDNVVGVAADGPAPNADGAIRVRSGAQGTVVAANTVVGGLLVEGVGTTRSRLDGNALFPSPASDRGIRVGLGASQTRIEGNRLVGLADAAVRLAAGADGGVLAGNVISGTRGVGVQVDAGSYGIRVGERDAAPNVIVGGTGPGLRIAGDGHEVTNNRIGVGLDDGPFGNGVAGVWITGSENQVGPDNQIAHNEGAGITVASGTGNRLVGNRIWSNAGPPIDLGADGPTANDPGDDDVGPNLRVNFPQLAPALVSTGGMTTTLEGTGRSAAGISGVIEVHAALGCTLDPETGLAAAYPEGVTSIGVTAVGPAGHTRYEFDVPEPPRWVAATFTSDDGNTSEVGPCVPVHRARLYLPWSVQESRRRSRVGLGGGRS